jgi:hypothetical protein
VNNGFAGPSPSSVACWRGLLDGLSQGRGHERERSEEAKTPGENATARRA